MPLLWAAALCRILAIGSRLALAGHRHPVGGNADQLGTLQRQLPVGLGKPAIVADRHADPADRRIEHRQAKIARLEIELLSVPQMQLAVGADMAGRPAQHGALKNRSPSRSARPLTMCMPSS